MRARFQFKKNRPLQPLAGGATLRVSKLAPGEPAEVVDFLSRRLDRTFALLGFIYNNGLVSSHNRGTFYACRDRCRRYAGVRLPRRRVG